MTVFQAASPETAAPSPAGDGIRDTESEIGESGTCAATDPHTAGFNTKRYVI